MLFTFLLLLLLLLLWSLITAKSVYLTETGSFPKTQGFPDPSFLSLYYSLISSTFLRICADPSRADFWMVSKERDTPTITRKDVRRSVIVPNAPIIIGMTVVCAPHSFEIFHLRSSYFSIFSLLSSGFLLTWITYYYPFTQGLLSLHLVIHSEGEIIFCCYWLILRGALSM